MRAEVSSQQLQRRIDAAQGRVDCDVVINNVKYLDVFGCQWKKGSVGIVDGMVVGVEPGLKGKQEVKADGKFLVPGFVDAHVHVESSMMLPAYFEKAVLSRGTTTAICDPHELTNVLGISGLKYFLEQAAGLSMDLWVMLSSCVPATHLETNGGGVLGAEDLWAVANHPRALGLAEMMNIPGVLNAEPSVLEKLSKFSQQVIDGHSPLLRGKALSAYLAAGINSCHESSQLDEATEKLSKGMSVWIREGSVAKDLDALIPLLTMATSTSVGFCTDDRNPFDIAEEGHIDHLVRQACRKGIAPEVSYRAASWSVARHYGLDRGPNRIGAVAPGYRADLILLADAETCSIESCLKAGVWVAELDRPVNKERPSGNTIVAEIPEASQLTGPEGQVHVIGVEPGKIITTRSVQRHTDEGVRRISVLERYGHGRPPANAYVRGFGNLRGAIASSVGHDSHNLIVVGDQPDEMRLALGALIESGGGFCVVQGGKVASLLALPFGGLMSEQKPEKLKNDIVKLKQASSAIGCELVEPFLQLAFLSLPVIPSLKLTDRGLVDVDKFEIIPVKAS